MDRNQLEEALQALHEELDHCPTLDEHSRQLLVELKNDIDELLERSGDVESPGSLDKQIRKAIIHFEGSHPQLSLAINRVADALARMGI